jgi:hypothetical protein
MKTIAEIRKLVDEYAAQSRIFITPTSPNDPLVPQPSKLTADQQADFYHSLMEALAEGAIKAKIPPEALIACQTWSQVRILVFHWQE